MNSWSESNRLHSTNKRLAAADDAIIFDDEETEEEYEARMREEAYDDYEAAQLQKLDEIMDGDWPESYARMF